jgi:hypothetical protein
MVDFKVIEIVYGSKPYPLLLGLDWDFDNHTLIDFKKRQMVFEVVDWKVTSPLDPTEGRRYMETGKGKQLDNLYNMIARMDDYVNPTTDGALSWQSISYQESDSEEALEHWQ